MIIMPLQYPDLGSDTTNWLDLNIIFLAETCFATTHMNDRGMHPCNTLAETRVIKNVL